MIVIDVDSLNGRPSAKEAVRQIVARALIRKTAKNGEDILVAKQPIYWFSKHKITIQDIDAMGLPAIGTAWSVTSVVDILAQMVGEIDRVAQEMGMCRMSRFRNPVTVITDNDLGAIENLGAKPLPVQFFEVSNGRF